MKILYILLHSALCTLQLQRELLLEAVRFNQFLRVVKTDFTLNQAPFEL
jgi:hypothetical protein